MKVIKRTRGRNNPSNTSDLFDQATAHLPPVCVNTLKELRALILDVQDENPEIGELSEVLRWGQPSYLTEQTGSGSMIRLGVSKSEKPAMFFHCGTSLIETFRAQYTDVFDFEGNRALVVTEPLSDNSGEIKHCVQQALTYKLRK